MIALLADKFSVTSDQARWIHFTWQQASNIIPLVNQFHWRDWDFQWAVEGCMDEGKGFHTVNDFISVKPMEGSGLVSIPDYVAVGPDPQGSAEAERMTPPGIAARLASNASISRIWVGNIRKPGPVTSVELAETVADIEAMMHLGDYYSSKILGATDLAMFRKTGDAKLKASAIAHLEKAAAHCQAYADNASKRYRPQLLARTRVLDFQAMAAEGKKDIDIARAAK